MSGQGTQSDAEQKKRSIGFPQLALRDSIEAIVTLGQHGPVHSQDAAAAYLGHSTSNSGAFRAKLASLRDWGLLARGDKDKVRLSELAQGLVLQAPEHGSARELLLAAFESCRSFGMLYNDSAKDLPLDLQRLRTIVVMRHGVASDQADRFVESFIQSVVYAGLGRFDGTRVILYPRDNAFAHETSTSQPQAPTPVPSAETTLEPPVSSSHTGASSVATESITRVAAEPLAPVALRQSWQVRGGEIEFIIRTSEPLPASIYALVASMVQVAEQMQDKLTDTTGSTTKVPSATESHGS